MQQRVWAQIFIVGIDGGQKVVDQPVQEHMHRYKC